MTSHDPSTQTEGSRSQTAPAGATRASRHSAGNSSSTTRPSVTVLPDGMAPTASHQQLQPGMTGHRSFSEGTSRPVAVESGVVAPPAVVPKHYYRVDVAGDRGGMEMRAACAMLKKALELRKKYKVIDMGQRYEQDHVTPQRVLANVSSLSIQVIGGIYQFSNVEDEEEQNFIPWRQYARDINTLLQANADRACNAACRYRLQVIEDKFSLHQTMNTEIEETGEHGSGSLYGIGAGGVYGTSTRIDNCVSLQCGMNALVLLRFIQQAYRMHGDTVVRYSGTEKASTEEEKTLRQMFEHLHIEDPSHLTVDGLGLHPPMDKHVSRFDVLDHDASRRKRTAAPALLSIFLSRDSGDDGKLFADLVTPLLRAPNVTGQSQPTLKSSDINMFSDLSGPTMAIQTSTMTQRKATEYSIPLYGLGEDEWLGLGKWFHMHKLADAPNNRYVIEIFKQAPRKIREEMLTKLDVHMQHIDNIFQTLFNATKAQEDPKFYALNLLLDHVGSFSIRTPEEGTSSNVTDEAPVDPSQMEFKKEVSDYYFAYYIWANLASLNAFRKRCNRNTFEFRAFAGHTSSKIESLLYSYLLCNSVTHAVRLEDHPTMQYLYGMHGIGVTVSPLMSNGMGLPYVSHPFPKFFRRSLKITLCTDAPLHYHHQEDPLLEEYATAAKIYRLNSVDVAEVARNSVLISGFPLQRKVKWLGHDLQDSRYTHVSPIRLQFRNDIWAEEMRVVLSNVQDVAARQRASVLYPSAAPAAEELEETTSAVAAVVPPTAPPAPPSATRRLSARDIGEIDYGQVFPRIQITGPADRDHERTATAQLLVKALEIRNKYIALKRDVPVTAAQGGRVSIEDCATMNYGVFVPYHRGFIPHLPEHLPKFGDGADGFFVGHIQFLSQIITDPQVKALATRRLHILDDKFKLHKGVAHSVEASQKETRLSSNRDFYQTAKVDNNVRMEKGMTSRQLLKFIQNKAQHGADDIVWHQKDQEPLTLRQLFIQLKIDPKNLTVDHLNLAVDPSAGMDVERFLPDGRDKLLTLLLKSKQGDVRDGRYFAELTKVTFDQLQRDRFTFAENRLNIYGGSRSEWMDLAKWFDTHGMNCYNNRWMVQFPRIYDILKREKRVSNFEDYLANLFEPLWDVTLDPTKFPQLFHFLQHISGFDCIDNENLLDEMHITANMPTPPDWNMDENPPFNYYMYYLWANIRTLNEYRIKKGLSTFLFRPSCGESGSMDHILGGFLLANGVSYGITLENDPVLQYLFYLAQVPIAVCPLSNNTNIIEYLNNPFPVFFRRGLNVSLATDCPLQYHHTQEPLIEEYSIASKVWKFTPTDMCEVARNSVKSSGFSDDFKRVHLGDLYELGSSAGNDEDKTHLSNIRVAYRWETYHAEAKYLESLIGTEFKYKAMTTSVEEEEKKKEHKARAQQQVVNNDGIIAQSTDDSELRKLKAKKKSLKEQFENLEMELNKQQRTNQSLKENYDEQKRKREQLQKLRRSAMEEREATKRKLEASQAGSGIDFASAAKVVSAAIFLSQELDAMQQQSELHRVPSGSSAISMLMGGSSVQPDLSSTVGDIEPSPYSTSLTGSKSGGGSDNGNNLSPLAADNPVEPKKRMMAGSEAPWSRAAPLFGANASEKQSHNSSSVVPMNYGTVEPELLGGPDDDIARMTQKLLQRQMKQEPFTPSPPPRRKI